MEILCKSVHIWNDCHQYYCPAQMSKERFPQTFQLLQSLRASQKFCCSTIAGHFLVPQCPGTHAKTFPLSKERLPTIFPIKKQSESKSETWVLHNSRALCSISVPRHSRKDFSTEGGVCVFDGERQRSIRATLDQSVRVKQPVSCHRHHLSSAISQHCHLARERAAQRHNKNR